MEHPDITKMNQNGYLSKELAKCASCDDALSERSPIYTHDDDLYCCVDCVVDVLYQKPAKFGIEKTTLS